MSKKITLEQSGDKVAARAVVFRFLPAPPSVTDKASGAADKGKPRVTVGRKAMYSSLTPPKVSPHSSTSSLAPDLR